jgi:hypothetical protein
MFVYALPVSSAAVALSSLDRLILQKQNPRGLLYIIQLTPTTRTLCRISSIFLKVCSNIYLIFFIRSKYICYPYLSQKNAALLTDRRSK